MEDLIKSIFSLLTPQTIELFKRLVNKTPNDADLGAFIRKVVNESNA